LSEEEEIADVYGNNSNYITQVQEEVDIAVDEVEIVVGEVEIAVGEVDIVLKIAMNLVNIMEDAVDIAVGELEEIAVGEVEIVVKIAMNMMMKIMEEDAVDKVDIVVETRWIPWGLRRNYYWFNRKNRSGFTQDDSDKVKTKPMSKAQEKTMFEEWKKSNGKEICQKNNIKQ